MFNTLKVIAKSSNALNRSQKPISIILSSVLPKRSIRSIYHQCGQSIFVNTFQSQYLNRRYKHTKKNSDDSDDELDLDKDDSKHLITFRTSTMRMDSILKQALGKSRSKIEVAFYESRIRINGEKVLKKSHTLDVGDEVDLIKGLSPNNPDFLLVSRVEILSAKLDGDELVVKVNKFKTLLIDNYDNKWKPS